MVSIICFSVISFVFSCISKETMSNFNGYTIVIDAGHGGRDGGSVGVLGSVEKHLNLEYVMELKDILIDLGYKVVLTRKNDDGLYSATDKNKKISDLNERMRIIKKANPNLMISIHMNSFTSSSSVGPIAYYKFDDRASERVADLVQKCFNVYCNARWQEGKAGDYYILNNSYYTSVLIECGFISNAEEEKLLNTKEYRKKLMSAVAGGIGLYFGIVKEI